MRIPEKQAKELQKKLGGTLREWMGWTWTSPCGRIETKFGGVRDGQIVITERCVFKTCKELRDCLQTIGRFTKK